MTRTHVRKTAGRRSTDRQGGAMPGWVYLLVGLSIGLAVAWAVFVDSNKQRTQPAEAAADAPAEKQAPQKTAPVVIVEEPVPEGEVTYDFYNMLPSLDVELYEEKIAPAAAAAQPEVTKPGTYIIQAGSFSAFADANRRKAELGLLGVHTEIKAGDANGRTVYRVYTDPLSTPEEVSRTSALLTSQGIDILLKRVGD